jgi:hypothetical protein
MQQSTRTVTIGVAVRAFVSLKTKKHLLLPISRRLALEGPIYSQSGVDSGAIDCGSKIVKPTKTTTCAHSTYRLRGGKSLRFQRSSIIMKLAEIPCLACIREISHSSIPNP